jgi:hypothetical protein
MRGAGKTVEQSPRLGGRSAGWSGAIMREQHCATPPVEDQVNAKNPHNSLFIGRLVNPPFYELHSTHDDEG